MNKQKIVPFAALTLIILGGAVAGITSMVPATAHAQAATTSVQQPVIQKETGKEVLATQETAETAVEPANEKAQDANLPGGGHQDTGETADHQFEGVE